MNKILTSKNELKKQIFKLKKKNKKIVLVHGVFDIFHLGHLYYFEEAKTFGDILVVSVTTDQFVSKGLNKPYFNEKDRLLFLSHFSIVDYVYCNDAKDSSFLIKSIRPNFYVKGPDYSTKKGDEAGNLKKEMAALKKVGGKFIITSGRQFSSTKIINEKLNIANFQNNEWIKKIKSDSIKKNYLNNFHEVINKTKKQNILIIGEIIFDEYNYVNPLGQPSKENILSVSFNKKETFFGGTLPVVKNIAQICNNITFISIYNDKSIISKINKYFSGAKIKLKLFMQSKYEDIIKKRYLNSKTFSKIFEVYKFKNIDFYDEKLVSYLEKNIKKFDQVIVCDFGHGLINNKIANILSSKSKFISANIQTNSGNRGYNLFMKYPKLDFLCLDEPEVRLGMRDKSSQLNKIITSLTKSKYKKIMITRGVEGLNYKSNSRIIHIPALTVNIKDTLGAGDAAFSFASCFVRNTKNDKLISLISAIAGALKVGIVGHSLHVNLDDVYKTLRSILK